MPDGQTYIYETAPESYNQTTEGDRLTEVEKERMQVAKNRPYILQTDPAA